MNQPIDQDQTWIQIKQRGGISWSAPAKAGYIGEEIDTIDHAIRSFGFLLPGFQRYSYSDLAALIAKNYDLSNPQTKTICDLLSRSNSDTYV